MATEYKLEMSADDAAKLVRAFMAGKLNDLGVKNVELSEPEDIREAIAREIDWAVEEQEKVLQQLARDDSFNLIRYHQGMRNAYQIAAKVVRDFVSVEKREFQ